MTLLILIKMYRSPIQLFVRGTREISSIEGTTHCDLLAMTIYALAISPLISKLKKSDMTSGKPGVLMMQQVLHVHKAKMLVVG